MGHPPPSKSPKTGKRSMLNRLRPNSWVMLHEAEGFVRLPNEKILYTSPPRTSINLQPLSTRSGGEPFSIQSSTGCVHLTNQRIVYLPANSTPQFQSFSAPILNLHDTHVSAPFFGPNVWTSVVQPVAGGGIPPSHIAVQLKMTFKEGGAFDFHSSFERIKERLQQIVEQARDSGLVDGSSTGAGRGGAPCGINFSNVHFEDLPAYEGPRSNAPNEPNLTSASTLPPFSAQSPNVENASRSPDCDQEARFESPTEPPPGYEEAQQQGVSDLEDRLRRAQ